MIEYLTDPSIWVAFATLTFLEIVLGIDNVIFISIVAGKLPSSQQQRARVTGLMIALVMRILLLMSLAWLVGLTKPIATVFDFEVSWRDILFFAGGLFLIAKATIEIYATVEGVQHSPAGEAAGGAASLTFNAAIVQIVMLDLVFSFDSIMTAVGLSRELPVMVAAIVIAMIVMVLAAKPIGDFVMRHLSIKMLALAFLLLIGVVLIADGLHVHIPKAYIYFSLAFSISVQALVMLASSRREKAGQKT